MARALPLLVSGVGAVLVEQELADLEVSFSLQSSSLDFELTPLLLHPGCSTKGAPISMRKSSSSLILSSRLC